MACQIHSAVMLQNQDCSPDVQGKRILVSLIIIITGGMITIIIITIVTLMVKLPLTQQRFMAIVLFHAPLWQSGKAHGHLLK